MKYFSVIQNDTRSNVQSEKECKEDEKGHFSYLHEMDASELTIHLHLAQH